MKMFVAVWAKALPYILMLVLAFAAPVWAVQPDEILSDPALEARARDLSEGLRCPVCRNESIDESSADISRDLRLLLRERLVAGDSDAAAVQYLVDRYGTYILLSPPVKGANLALWWAAPMMLLIASGIALATIRGRAKALGPVALSDAEQTRLAELLNK